MARQAPDPSARLATLRAARAKLVATPDVPERVTAGEMAKIVGLSWRRLSDQIEKDPDFPVARRGSEGLSYEFAPLDVVDHMIRRLDEQLDTRRAKAERMAAIAGMPAETASHGLSIDELIKLDGLQTAVQRRKIEQRQYVRADEHANVIADIFTTMQSETLAITGRLDPAGRWPANVRAEVTEAMRSLLVRLHDKLGDRLDPDARSKSAPRKRARRARA